MGVEETSKESGPKIEDIISSLLNLSGNIMGRYPINLSDELAIKKQRIREIKHDIESRQIKIEGLETRLNNLDIDAIDELNRQIDENQKLIKTLTEENARLKEDLETYPLMLEELEILISQAIAD